MLLQIDVARRPLAAKILLWVALAVRPMTLTELGTAVGIDTKRSDGFGFAKVVRDQLSYCGDFLTIESDRVGLIHQSAKDYLLRDTPDSNPELEIFRVKRESANLEIARKCLDYLQNGALKNGEVDLVKDIVHLKAFPLLSYAALHWPEHARSLARSEDIFDLSLPFYHEKSRIRASWLKIYDAIHMDMPYSLSTLLHLASYLGILPLAENLLPKQGLINRVRRYFYLNKRDGHGYTSLILAASQGHKAVVRLLLDKGAYIEAKNCFEWTALMAGAMSGHEAVLQLLVDKGADIEAKDKTGRTALIWTAYRGQEAVARLLLENGADIEAKDRFGLTALIWAAVSQHEAVIRLLLRKGADVEAKDDFRQTALIVAAEHGHETIIRLLLEKGAEIEAKDRFGMTALIWAAVFGHEDVIRLLLEKGANIEAADEAGTTALIWMAYFGRSTAAFRGGCTY